MEVFSGARAYVGGEGLWSKSQKHAVYYLTKYAHSRQDADYRSYLQAIAVPLGDKKARLELERPEPDYAVVYQGFTEGRNHPEDLWIMARFFRWFRAVPYVGRAVVIWTRADELIAAMIERGEELRRGISTGQISPQRIDAILADIETLDKRLTVLEDDFSYTLGAAARWAKRFLASAMLVAAVIFVAVGAWMGLIDLQAPPQGALRPERRRRQGFPGRSGAPDPGRLGRRSRKAHGDVQPDDGRPGGEPGADPAAQHRARATGRRAHGPARGRQQGARGLQLLRLARPARPAARHRRLQPGAARRLRRQARRHRARTTCSASARPRSAWRSSSTDLLNLSRVTRSEVARRPAWT